MTDYLNFGACLITADPKSRTICGELDGQKIWVKQTVPPKARIWHKLQRFLASLLGQPILRATVSAGGPENLRAEAKRLKMFQERGFKVPEVLAVYDDLLVMTDAGPQLRAVLDSTMDKDARHNILKTTMRAMSALHQAGLAHGRPYMRDMTWDGKDIGFLDLEEDPVTVMPLVTAQARDIWIFLSAASRYARCPGDKAKYEPELIRILFNEYKSGASKQVLKELQDFVLFLEPLRKLLDRKMLWKKIGTDARQSVFINRCLAACLEGACSSSNGAEEGK
jgi:tRNA A-37 threonylcarbamoyl transferase component Bud32